MEEPAIVKELLNLKAHVSDPSLISFQNISLQSDTALCCQNVIGADKYVVQVNPRAPTSKEQHKMSAELVAPHPTRHVLALKGNFTIQVYDFDLNSKLKTFKMTEAINFMKWIDVSTLAVVTVSAVYHCKLDADSQPILMFQRHPNLAGCNIINYKVDAKQQNCLLIGSKVDPAQSALVPCTQMFSVTKGKTQFLPANTGAFVSYRPENRKEEATLMVVVLQGKILINELDEPAGTAPIKIMQDVKLVQPNDIPLSVEYSPRYGFIFLITAMGILYAYDVATGTLAFMHKISNATVFSTVSENKDHGFIAVNQAGQVLSVTVNSKGIIPFIKTKLNNIPLAVAVASRANLSGTDELFTEQFEAFFAQQNYSEAARVAATSPNGCLRTATIIQRFKTAPVIPGQAPPLMQYLVKVLDITRLNDRESLELVMPVIQKGQKQMVQSWLTNEKLTASEELGDFLRQYDRELALVIYLQCRCHEKVVQLYCELGEYEKVIQYSKEQSYRAPYLDLFRGVCQLSPPGAEKFCRLLYNQPEGPLIDLGEAIEIFYQFDLIKEMTAVVVDILGANDPSMGRLQTRYLEILLQKRPDVADQLFNRSIFKQYDQSYIAHCCEKAGLYNRALEHYDSEQDILRCIVHTSMMTQEFICNYVLAISSQQDVKIGYACLSALTKVKSNMPLCVAICQTCKDVLDPKEMIKILESNGMVEGVYRFLQGIATTVPDKELVFRFITSAVKLGQYKDVERVVRESKSYDPVEVKDFLKEAKIDPQSLMIVCDRFGYIEELIKFLYQNGQQKAIERYVTGFGHKAAPQVVGTLLDLEAPQDLIYRILENVKDDINVGPLVEECEKRNNLRLLQPFLEDLVQNHNNTDVECHSALAKIYVATNQNADAFLQDNPYYDTLVVGKYCEKRDPRRAVLCYRHGQNDKEMIELTNKNSFFKDQAKYLIERKDNDLWLGVLTEENENRRQLIDQVIQYAVPACKDAEQISAVVKAFRNANLPNELIELLEVIMLRKTEFSNHRNLQNLLLITAIQSKAQAQKLSDYINRLDNYDAPQIATYAFKSGYGEQAYEIYKKFNLHEDAIKVLLTFEDGVDRAYDYAVDVNTKDCWSLVGQGQLEKGLIEKAIDSYIRADDPSNYVSVINACEENNLYQPLVKFLKLARQLKDKMIDTELVYALAKIDSLGELEETISQSTLADLQAVGDRLFDEHMYRAAHILFKQVGNYARLASTYIHLQDYQSAVEAAKKSQSIRVCKEVCFACVEVKQFTLAQKVGTIVVIHGDDLDELIEFYTVRGYFDEVIALLELCLPNKLQQTDIITAPAIYPALAILYSKFKPEKLIPHIKEYHDKLTPRHNVLAVTERNLQWTELVLLHFYYEDFDSACKTMLEHIDSFDHEQMKDIAQKVSNLELYYKAIDVYLNQHPDLLCDLLKVISTRIDNSRVVQQLRAADQLPLIREYLKFVQETSTQQNPDVNEAMNDLLVEEEDVDGLREAIIAYPMFDQLALARRLEKHELLRFRRLATWLYTRNKRYAHSVELAKKDQMYQDAMEATAASGDRAVAEELLRFFAMEIDEKDRAACFAACLYTCYEILEPAVVMEIAWLGNLREYAMPYFLNTTHEYTTLVQNLQTEVEKLNKHKDETDAQRQQAMAEEAEAAAAAASSVSMGGMGGMPAMSPMGLPRVASTPMTPTMAAPMNATPMPFGGAPPMGMPYSNPAMGYPPTGPYNSPF